MSLVVITCAFSLSRKRNLSSIKDFMAFSLNRFLLFEKPPEEKLTAQQQLQPKIPPKITARNLECRDDDSNFSVSAPSTQHMNETHSHCLVAAWLFFIFIGAGDSNILVVSFSLPMAIVSVHVFVTCQM